jgi:hypothetical protein
MGQRHFPVMENQTVTSLFGPTIPGMDQRPTPVTAIQMAAGFELDNESNPPIFYNKFNQVFSRIVHGHAIDDNQPVIGRDF